MRAPKGYFSKVTYLRYLEALGHEIGPIPDGLYPGEYLKEVGMALVRKTGMKLGVSSNQTGCL